MKSEDVKNFRLSRMGLQMDPETGEFHAVDRFNPEALSKIKAPGNAVSRAYERTKTPIHINTGEFSRLAREYLEEEAKHTPQDKNPLKLLPPDRAIDLLAQGHMGYFSDDFWAAKDEFIKLRYHIGNRGDPWEFYSESFPLDHISWDRMKLELGNHIEEELGGLELETRRDIPVRMIFFHDPGIYAWNSDKDPSEVLKAPLSFATWLSMTAQEFSDYVSKSSLPAELKVGFDANYPWHGDRDLLRMAFGYTKHWTFFKTICESYSEVINRDSRMTENDAPMALINLHTSGRVAEHVLSLVNNGVKSGSAVYQPRMEFRMNSDYTQMFFSDNIGLIYALAGETESSKSDFHMQLTENGDVCLMKYNI